MEYGTLQEWLLKFVLTPGGAGVVLYFILEKLPYVDAWFDGLVPAMKRLVVLVLSLGIPLAGVGVAIVLGYLVFNENTVYLALQVGFAVFMGSQITHMFTLEPKVKPLYDPTFGKEIEIIEPR